MNEIERPATAPRARQQSVRRRYRHGSQRISRRLLKPRRGCRCAASAPVKTPVSPRGNHPIPLPLNAATRNRSFPMPERIISDPDVLGGKTACRQEALESPMEYTKRLIKRSFPDINIAKMLPPHERSPLHAGMRCGFTVSVWSEQRPRVVKNLRQLFSREMLLFNNSREMSYFDAQLPSAKARVAFLRYQIDTLLKTPRTRKAVAAPQQWLYELCDKRPEGREAKQRLKQAACAANKFDSEEWGKPVLSPSDKCRAVRETGAGITAWILCALRASVFQYLGKRSDHQWPKKSETQRCRGHRGTAQPSKSVAPMGLGEGRVRALGSWDLRHQAILCRCSAADCRLRVGSNGGGAATRLGGPADVRKSGARSLCHER